MIQYAVSDDGNEQMTNDQIHTLLAKGYTPEHIANYGQVSMAQIERVIDDVKSAFSDLWKDEYGIRPNLDRPISDMFEYLDERLA